MKKKILAVLLASVMVFSLSACGQGGGSTTSEGTSSSESSEEASNESNDSDSESSNESSSESSGDGITLTLAMIGDGGRKEDLDGLMQQYTDMTGVKVDTIYIPTGWGEYCTKIQSMVGGGDDLDLAILAIEGVSKFYELGIAEPIDDWIEANPEVAQEILDDTSPSFQRVFQNDGKTYAFPFSYNNVVMHFSLDRLEEAGLEVPGENWDKDEFLRYCEALTTEKDGVKQYAIAVPDGYFVAEAWLLNNGAAFMNEDFTKSEINSPASVEMFQLWQDLVYEYGYAPIPEENVSSVTQIINGQTAMGTWGRWPTQNYVADDFRNVEIQYLPSFSVNQQIGGVDGIFTLANSKHKNEAKDLAAWMSQKDFAGQYLTVGNIPASNSLAAEKISELGIPHNYEIFYAGSNTDIYKPVSAPPQFTECSDIVLTAISEICVNRSDVQETLDRAAADMDALLAENQ